MTDRRFHEGDEIDLPPMQYRLVHGRKGPKDLRLEWRWVIDDDGESWPYCPICGYEPSPDELL
jgi:hypothetical protein